MRWIDPLRWLEGLLRAVLWSLESRLAIVTIAALALLITVAVIWWNSSDEVRNFGLIAAAVIALPLAIWRSRVSERQAATAQRALLDQRYHRAVEMLASADGAVRKAAARTLEQLVEEYPLEYGEPVAILLDQGDLDDSQEEGNDDHRTTEAS